jgi:hypothetical protein
MIYSEGAAFSVLGSGQAVNKHPKIQQRFSSKSASVQGVFDWLLGSGFLLVLLGALYRSITLTW